MPDTDTPSVEPTIVAWADDRAMAGEVGNVASQAAKGLLVTRSHQYDRMMAERLSTPLVTLEAYRTLAAERDSLASKVRELEASGIHTCNPWCERPVCVLVRERDTLARRVAELEDELHPFRDTFPLCNGCASPNLCGDGVQTCYRRSTGVSLAHWLAYPRATPSPSPQEPAA